MIDLETLIGSYAFPIIVCLWFMLRTENFIKDNTTATQQLQQTLEKLYLSIPPK